MPGETPKTDEQVKAQFLIDKAANAVPTFSKTNNEAAQAFVDYMNTIAGRTIMRKVTKTTYSFEPVKPA